MSEWRLFPEGEVPIFCTPGFFARHPWVPGETQTGHGERIAMVADLVKEHVGDAKTLSDLGSGDGSLLRELIDLPLRMWGYDAGWENVHRAAILGGARVTCADFLNEQVDLGDVVVMSEVLEHLYDPHGLLKAIPARKMVASSPSSETGDWHYVHHAWAWDMDGYRQLFTDAGWTVLDQRQVFGGINKHCERDGEQWFQALVAVRDEA